MPPTATVRRSTRLIEQQQRAERVVAPKPESPERPQLGAGTGPRATRPQLDADTSQILHSGRYNVWITSPVQSDLRTVPGIGERAATLLETEGVGTTNQLIGKFLWINRDEQLFKQWLENIGIQKYGAWIVRAVADKVAILFGDYSGPSAWEASVTVSGKHPDEE